MLAKLVLPKDPVRLALVDPVLVHVLQQVVPAKVPERRRRNVTALERRDHSACVCLVGRWLRVVSGAELTSAMVIELRLCNTDCREKSK